MAILEFLGSDSLVQFKSPSEEGHGVIVVSGVVRLRNEFLEVLDLLVVVPVNLLGLRELLAKGFIASDFFLLLVLYLF